MKDNHTVERDIEKNPQHFFIFIAHMNTFCPLQPHKGASQGGRFTLPLLPGLPRKKTERAPTEWDVSVMQDGLGCGLVVDAERMGLCA